MAKSTAHRQNTARACFHVGNLLAQKFRPFSDDEFVKECMDILVENMCPEKSPQLANISLSRHIQEMSENISNSLRSRIASLKFSSHPLNENTDVSDTAQLAVLIRGIDSEFSVRGAPWSAANRLHGQRTGAFSWRPVLGLSRKTDQFRLDPTQNCAPGWWYDRV